VKIELSQDELSSLETLLAKEEGDIRVEIIRSRNFEYEQMLKERKELIHNLLEKIQNVLPLVTHEMEEAYT
jgi:hypothetical protein